MSTDDAGAENTEAKSDAPEDKPVEVEKTDAAAGKADEPAKAAEPGKAAAAVAAEPVPAPTAAKKQTTDQPAADAQPAAAANRSSLVPVIAAFVAGVLLVAAVTALVVFYRQSSDRKAQLDAHAEATKAACEYGKLISTYDAQTIDEYLKKVDAASTGDWKDQFTKLGQDLKGVVVDAKAQSSTYDMQCGFQSGDKDSADVLVVIGQTTTNINIQAANKPPSKVELVVVAGLQKSGDKWLVDKFDLPILKQMGN